MNKIKLTLSEGLVTRQLLNYTWSDPCVEIVRFSQNCKPKTLSSLKNAGRMTQVEFLLLTNTKTENIRLHTG